MTEAEWHECYDDAKRLRLLWESGVASDRKLRLLGVACGRESEAFRAEPAVLSRLAVVERYADGLASDAELAVVLGEAEDDAGRWSEVGPESPEPLSDEWNRRMARAAAHRAVGRLATVAISDPYLVVLVTEALWDLWGPGVSPIGDIFGNPFRPDAFAPEWRTESVVALARGIYETGAWDRMGVLADALDDAGCADPEVLGHARAAGSHWKGCWVVDSVLGRS